MAPRLGETRFEEGRGNGRHRLNLKYFKRYAHLRDASLTSRRRHWKLNWAFELRADVSSIFASANVSVPVFEGLPSLFNDCFLANEKTWNFRINFSKNSFFSRISTVEMVENTWGLCSRAPCTKGKKKRMEKMKKVVDSQLMSLHFSLAFLETQETVKASRHERDFFFSLREMPFESSIS